MKSTGGPIRLSVPWGLELETQPPGNVGEGGSSSCDSVPLIKAAVSDHTRLEPMEFLPGEFSATGSPRGVAGG